jgi:hypothetical protein
MSLRILTPLTLVAGLALMLPFEATVTRVLGVACLLAFVVCGTFLIAAPGFLGGEPGDGRDDD